MQYYIGRCLGPCVEGLTTPERYAEAVHDVRLFLEGRGADLSRSLQQRMAAAAEREQYELAAKYRDLISTVELLESEAAHRTPSRATMPTSSAITTKTRCWR